MKCVSRSRAWLAVGTATATVVGMSMVMAAPPVTAASPVTVSLTFTDGFATHYKYGRPVLQSHGVHGTFYTASNWALSNDAKYMRTYQLDDLYRDGNEIGGMGKDHKDLTATYFSDPAADLAYKRDQVCGDRQVWTNLGYDPQSFAYPATAANASAESIVSGCGYLAGRLIGGLTTSGPTYAEAIPPANPFRLRTASLPTSPMTLQSLQNAVLAASDHGGGWLPISFNQVCSQTDPAFSTCMGTTRPVEDTVLSAFLDWLANGAPAGTTVRTVREVMGAPPPPPLPPRASVVSLTFDDGLASQYGLRSALAAHQAKATFYIPSGDIDSGMAGTMTWSEIQGLAGDGHDVGGHTVHHVSLTTTATTFDEKWHEACDDRARLVEKGLNPASFAYPFASFNATAESIIKGCGYQSGRTGGSLTTPGSPYAETIPPRNAYALRALGTTYNGPITLQALQDATNAVIDHGGGWLPMLFHEVCYPNASNYQNCMNAYRPVDLPTFEAYLTWLDDNASRGVSVRSVTDVMSGGQTTPVVVVTAPSTGSTVQVSRPVVSGSADPSGGDVTVDLYQGSYSTGSPMATLTAANTNGTWSAQPGSALAEGTYTVQARQSRGGVVGLSPPVTFTVANDSAAPVVTVTSPQNGDTVTVATPAISGTGGVAAGDADSVSVSVYSGSTPSGTPAQTLAGSVQSDGSWSVTPSALADGTYTVQATQSDDAGHVGTSNAVTFTVATPSPAVVVSSASPAALPQGASGVTLTISGSGFVDGAQASVSGSGVTVTDTAVTSETSLAVTVNVAADATTGPRDIVVAASGRTNGTCTGCLTVNAAPRPTSTSPNNLGQGAAAVTVTVAGSGFQAGATVAVSGSGVSATVNSVTATSVSLAVSVDGQATAGARELTVVNPDRGSGTCQACFTVVAGPKVTSVSPATVSRGKSTPVVVTGSAFDSTLKVTFSGSGVTAGSFKLISATTFTIVVKVTARATLGARSMTVSSTKTRGMSTLPNALTVVN